MKYFLYTIAVLAAGAIVYTGILGGAGIFGRQSPEVESEPAPVAAWETKTDDQASVTVAVTPIDMSPRSEEWQFEVVMNTHSVELDQDLVASAVLTSDRGAEYKPLRWDGAVGGHHREGVLVFAPVTPTPGSVELKIAGVGGIERSFTWQIK